MKGLSTLSRITGSEHDQISRILLGLIIDLPLPNGLSNNRLMRAVRGILEFMSLAQYPMHTDETLDLMEDALDLFHSNKDILVDLDIRQHFDFPKLHATGHYRYHIEMFGTTDNYNTAYTERLHIDFAKDAYCATNRKDEYSQMTMWLDRRERVLQHEKRIRRRLLWSNSNESKPPTCIPPPPPTLVYPRVLKMAKHPSARSVTLDMLRTQYGAKNFEAALGRFLILHTRPSYTRPQLETALNHFHAPFKYSVFHRIKFVSRDPYSVHHLESVVDSIHAQPPRHDKHGNIIPARFDTALIHSNPAGSLTNPRESEVGRIRCIFTLPRAILDYWFADSTPPSTHFAYVDWYTPLTQPHPHHGLYRISPLVRDREQQSSIVPVNLIWQSVHLFPCFAPVVDRSWTSSNVLDSARYFHINPYSSRFAYTSIY
jgi:hypothetical protein